MRSLAKSVGELRYRSFYDCQGAPVNKSSRREFVATIAAAGATLVSSSPAFSSLQQDSSRDTTAGESKAGSREIVPLQAVPFPMKDVRLLPGAFAAAAA